MSSLPKPEYSNQRFSVDADGNQVTDLVFASEPIGMAASEGYGWPQFEFGEQIGPEDRYTIARKLGWGMYSSTWLARDSMSVKNTFVAIKALTGHTTDMYERGMIWEADALRLVSHLPTSPHCTSILDEFMIVGKGSAGSHMCFVMSVYGGDLKALVQSRKTPLPFPIAKRILLHLLRGIAHAHERGIVHTDIKHDNIFFSTNMTMDDIEAWMREDPSRRHAPELCYDGVLQAAVSQPLPMITEEEAARTTYSLADFGSAQPSGLHTHHPITPLALRPPESYLGAEWDKPADIWTFGCLIFELVTRKPLFCYQRNKRFTGMDETENMLYFMMLHTRELFCGAQLRVSPNAPDYFNSDCTFKNLMKDPEVLEWPIKARIDELRVISDEEATDTARLIERCLRLNASDRASVTELLSDPWFNGVE